MSVKDFIHNHFQQKISRKNENDADIPPISEAEIEIEKLGISNYMASKKRENELCCSTCDTINFNNTVRGHFLRKHILEELTRDKEIQPVTLRGLTISDEIDLSQIQAKRALVFEKCIIERLNFASCTINELIINGCSIVEYYAHRSRVEGALIIKNTIFENYFSMIASIIKADVEFLNVEFANCGLECDRIRVEGAFFVRNSTVRGPLSAASAKIGNYVTFIESSILSQRGAAFNMSSSEVKGRVTLRSNVITSLDFALAVDFEGARVDLWINMFGSKITGTVNLANSKIGLVNLRGASFEKSQDNNIAIDARNSSIGAHFLVGRAASIVGQIDISHASIGGNFNVANTNIRSEVEPAIRAEQLKVGSDIIINTWRGDGSFEDSEKRTIIEGGIMLTSADVKGSVLIENVKFAGGYMIALNRMKVGITIVLTSLDVGFSSVNLANSKSVAYIDDEGSWPTVGTLQLDGFEYSRLAGASPIKVAERLKWLRRQPPEHRYRRPKPQPFSQLARVFKDMGHEKEARILSIHRNRQSYSRELILSPAWLKALALDISCGFGYRPWLALSWLFVFAAIGWFIFDGERSSFAPIKAPGFSIAANSTNLPVGYPKFSPLFYSIETLIPFVNLNQKEHWSPTSSETSDFLLWYRLFHLTIGWILATLFIGSVTGIIKRD